MSQNEILIFLKTNKKQNFRTSDIALLMDIRENNISRGLGKLYRAGFINKKYKFVEKKVIPYYSYKEAKE